jgi:hypothetical protein
LPDPERGHPGVHAEENNCRGDTSLRPDVHSKLPDPTLPKAEGNPSCARRKTTEIITAPVRVSIKAV